MRNALKDFGELVGKTVEGVFEDCWDWNCRVLTFTDGTYAAIRSITGYESEAELPELTALEPSHEKHMEALVQRGIMSKEDQDAFLSRMKSRQSMAMAQQEDAERATYERLRAKYESR